MTVDLLRHDLTKLEREFRFGGRPYPEGIEPFPRTLVGQGFFPGGDGLWRDPDETALRLPSPYSFPKNGIMFLGNDFGTLAGFQRWKHCEKPPTWRWLRGRLRVAKIAGELGFYANAYLGLRSDRKALAHPIENPTYSELCAEFLGIQISLQSPRLIVVLGPRPMALLSRILSLPERPIGALRQCAYGRSSISVVVVSHPHSDFGKGPSQRQAEGEMLAGAWATATNGRGLPFS